MARQIPATYMRGGTSKGVFFLTKDLPREPAQRDATLLRVVGSPDPYERQTDGMGGATTSTSKVVMVNESRRDDCDVDYLYGAVSIGNPLVDYSDGCDNLLAAVGPFAIAQGLVEPAEPLTRVRIWQVNRRQRVDAWVPVHNGLPVEVGVFQEDGVPFAAAEVRLDVYEPEAVPGALPMLPTGNVTDQLHVPGQGTYTVTIVSSGSPTLFLRADALGLTGIECPDEINRNKKLLNRLEQIRAQGAIAIGLAHSVEPRDDALTLSWVAPPRGYRTAVGRDISADSIDVLARILSKGKLRSGYAGTGSIALAAAAALPGSVVNTITRALPGVATRIGHVSGTLTVGAQLDDSSGSWHFEKAMLSRGARRIMTGFVHCPEGSGRDV